MKSTTKTEFGDFQTPQALAREACLLLSSLGETPDAVIEPTVGRGAFLLASARVFPNAQLHGWEINASHLAEAQQALEREGATGRTHLARQDFFDCGWESALARIPGRLLLLGNPPWVTSSAVSALNGTNLPEKKNFLGLRGIAARTGKANFDISEWMLIRLLQALGRRSGTLAMLCKMATARKVLRYSWQNDARISEATLYRIDAAKHFDASVEACLLVLRAGEGGPPEAGVVDGLAIGKAETKLGLVGKDLVSDLRAYHELRHLEGLSRWQWRSGVKHDCVSVMELKQVCNGVYRNNLDEIVSLEEAHLFPFLKCTDVANHLPPSRLLIATQQKTGDETERDKVLRPAYLGVFAKTPRALSGAEEFNLRQQTGFCAVWNRPVRVPALESSGVGIASEPGISRRAFTPWKTRFVR